MGIGINGWKKSKNMRMGKYLVHKSTVIATVQMVLSKLLSHSITVLGKLLSHFSTVLGK